MNTELIRKVIADQKEELKSKDRSGYVKRDSYDLAASLLGDPLVKVVTGVRRCGKSTFCHQLLEGRSYGHLNFDDERLRSVNSENLDLVLEVILMEYNAPDYLLFDEIQNVEGWELFVNRLLRQGYNVILTGSNSKMLSRELATHLTGRHVQIELFPFSFKEYVSKNGYSFDSDLSVSTKETAQVKLLLRDYCESGGFPELDMVESRQRYLQDLFDKIILRDIAERFKIRELVSLKELSIVALNYFSSQFSYTKLKNSLNFASVNTVKDYMGYLQDTYLMDYIRIFDYKIREEIRSPRKLYCIDTGLAGSYSFSLTEDYSKYYENLVYLELKRRYKEVYYWKSKNNLEVDFLLKQGRQLTKAIQVSVDISAEKTRKRELDALVAVNQELGVKNLLLLTLDNEGLEKYKNLKIQVLPIWKYLLSKQTHFSSH